MKVRPKKVAVVLFNLGGPIDQKSVFSFLYNLFSDPAILRVPSLFRKLLAWVIAKRRTPVAQEIYRSIGGGSPILENTKKQAEKIEKAISKLCGKDFDFKVFIAMRYAAPRASDVISELTHFMPDQIVRVPLYPQFSTTTSLSSLNEFAEHQYKSRILRHIKTKTVCCYPTLEGFIKGQARKIEPVLKEIGKDKAVRILYSAHGLPIKIVKDGDPYPQHLIETIDKLNTELNKSGYTNFESIQCYQSKVGPVEWLKPATDEEIIRAGKDGIPVVVVPLSFVSEHSETLVELDIEYRELAEKYNVTGYYRVETVQDDQFFMEGLAREILTLSSGDKTVSNGSKKSFCMGKSCSVCPYEQQNRDNYRIREAG